MTTKPLPGCTLILAAGLGQRYRQASTQSSSEDQQGDKLLAPSRADDPESLPVLLATLRACAGLTERCVLVLADDNPQRLSLAQQHAPALGYDILVIATNGLGHSLAQAVHYTPSATGWLVALADMPYVTTPTWERLAQTLQPDALALPTHQGRRGHPRVIGSHYAETLLALNADHGAWYLFNLAQVQEIAVEDPGVLIDIDIPSDRLQR